MRNLPLKSKGCQILAPLVYPISLIPFIQYTSTRATLALRRRIDRRVKQILQLGIWL